GKNGTNGRNGFPGRDGKDGKDMGQAEVFQLKAFIAAQHQQTQGVLGSAIAGIKASISSGFATVVSASNSVVNGANLALLLPVRPFFRELEERLLRGKRLTTKLSINSSWKPK
ncbi:hypothetical protein, partial [Nostoc sp. NMS4]|uniref:hypothetical protein n=1 Tax=Nostoc sp. NMS4 TaxID=2815390 RepID=UPI0025CCA699